MLKWLMPLFMLAASPASGAASSHAASAETYLRQLYAEYRAGGDGAAVKSPATVYSQSTYQLMEQVRSSDPDGMTGAVDADPICDCQDFEEIVVDDMIVRAADARSAKVSAKIRDRGMGSAARTLEFELRRGASGWRVHDVGSASKPSLRSLLLASLLRRPAAVFSQVQSSGDIAVPHVRVPSQSATRRMNLVLDRVRREAASQRQACLSGGSDQDRDFTLETRPEYNQDSILSLRFQGAAFCGGANGDFVQRAVTFDTMSGAQLDLVSLTGLSRAALGRLGRAHYRGEAACRDLLVGQEDAAALAGAYLSDAGLGLIYVFTVGAAESCGIEPAIVPWKVIVRRGRPSGIVRTLAQRAGRESSGAYR